MRAICQKALVCKIPSSKCICATPHTYQADTCRIHICRLTGCKVRCVKYMGKKTSFDMTPIQNQIYICSKVLDARCDDECRHAKVHKEAASCRKESFCHLVSSNVECVPIYKDLKETNHDQIKSSEKTHQNYQETISKIETDLKKIDTDIFPSLKRRKDMDLSSLVKLNDESLEIVANDEATNEILKEAIEEEKKQIGEAAKEALKIALKQQRISKKNLVQSVRTARKIEKRKLATLKKLDDLFEKACESGDYTKWLVFIGYNHVELGIDLIEYTKIHREVGSVLTDIC